MTHLHCLVTSLTAVQYFKAQAACTLLGSSLSSLIIIGTPFTFRARMDPSKQETNQKKASKPMARKETQEFQFVVYNTMTQQKEVFKPKTPGKVHMYVCGVTTYDFSHLGHARTAVSFDVLYRYLKHLGYDVTYVRNITDVDDKIIRRANETGEDPISLSDRYCKEYNINMSDLQCISPTHEPFSNT